jgi:hypothetical protein
MREPVRAAGAGRGPLIAAVVLAGLVGGLAGALVGRWSASDVRAGDAPGGASANDALVRELHALVTELRDDHLAQAAARSAGDAAPENQAEFAPAALVAPADGPGAMAELVAALEAVARRLEGASAGATIPPPDPAQRERVAAFLDPANDKAFVGTRLWSEQKLIDNFGVPDTITVSEQGETWQYRIDTRFVEFTIHDRRVVRMWAHR